MTKKLILSLLGAFSLFSTCKLEAQTSNGEIVNVAFTDLMAGQFNVGYIGAENYSYPGIEKLYLTGWKNGVVTTNKPGNYYGPGPEGLALYQSQNPAPVILGPYLNGTDTVYNLLDNHHRTTAYYWLSQNYTSNITVTYTNATGQVGTTNIGPAPNSVYVQQINDLSSYGTNYTGFWNAMLQGNAGGVTNFAPVGGGFAESTNQPTFVWNYNVGNLVTNLVTSNPPFIPGLTDDTLRSIAGDLGTTDPLATVGYLTRDGTPLAGGGSGTVLYYQEFYWANYLRPLIYWETTNTTYGMDSNALYHFTNYDAMVSFAETNLVLRPEAANLPGYLGGVPEPAPATLFLIGMAVFFLITKTKLFRKLASSFLR
jgi:hypothetical protein